MRMQSLLTVEQKGLLSGVLLLWSEGFCGGGIIEFVAV